MNAEQAEAIIKRTLDGHFFTLVVSPGLDADLTVAVRKVAKNFIPDHRPAWSTDMEGGEIQHHNATPFTAEQDAKLLEMRATGARWRVIGVAIGRCVNNTRDRYKAICRERGIDPGPARLPRPPKVPDHVKERAYALKRDGYSYSQIGEKLGLTKWQASDAVLQVKKRRAAA
jgi:hypothetical protein